MKARFENGGIALYPQLPQSFKNDEVNIIGEFDKLSKEELESYGFYDVVEPALADNEMYEKVIWDDSINSFIYTIVQKPTPIILPLTKYEFLSRFTEQERIDIYTEETTNINVRMWLEMFRVSESIDLKNPTTIQGIHALGQLGIITDERAIEILTY